MSSDLQPLHLGSPRENVITHKLGTFSLLGSCGWLHPTPMGAELSLGAEASLPGACAAPCQIPDAFHLTAAQRPIGQSKRAGLIKGVVILLGLEKPSVSR